MTVFLLFDVLRNNKNEPELLRQLRTFAFLLDSYWIIGINLCILNKTSISITLITFKRMFHLIRLYFMPNF